MENINTFFKKLGLKEEIGQKIFSEVNIINLSPGEKLNEISRSSNCNIGRMYRYATLLLGMRPADHEYKLMGLAAYNSEKYGKEAYNVYANTLQVDGLKFKYKEVIKDHFFYFKDKLEGQRFDAVAWGIQKRCEELLTEWVYNGIKETGIGNIIMSGGVAQNIKANKIITELDNLNQLYIPPGPGDESISIGAAFVESTKHIKSIDKIASISNGYFGPSYSIKQVENAIKNEVPKTWKVKKVNFDDVAKVLVKGDVVARFGLDNMEFGARALGNRSILANPCNPNIKEIINQKIKRRESFRPFAPAILVEEKDNWFVSKLENPYMSSVEDIIKEKRQYIPSVTHIDGTGRVQSVSLSMNKNFHQLIMEFYKISKVPILLNTSFNENEPIVMTPNDAIKCFERTKMDILVLNNFMIVR